ncbi:MAG TPA: NAD(P)-dependent alcohol dehydrogenase [Kofleriaceae bacterium]|nr:NAD(P)-dependent alcohol dehydrogenase [Kofleriaceae bacterium]
MRALRLTRWGAPAELQELPIPQPGPGQVTIRIAGAGACHSDLHLMGWPEGQLPWKLPFTLGHENAGWVHELGPGVTSVKPGDAVLVYGPWGCGMCRQCRLGRENTCDRAAEIVVAGGGLGLDGGMAEYMLVPSARWLVPLGALDPVKAAPLSDAALTPYHAIKECGDRLHAGASVVVIGIGGLGQMAIQLLKVTTGVRVIAIDHDDRKLPTARALGADVTLASDADTAQAIRRETRGIGADVVLDMVGSEATLALGARSLRAEGRLVIIGLGGGALPVSFFGLPYGAEVATSYWGTIPELIELVDLAAAKRFRLDVEVVPLSRALDAYARLKRGEIQGRAVIVPDR